MIYTDILYARKYAKKDRVAEVTINRPEVRNAFRTRTVAELTDAFLDARWDPAVGVAVLTGAGDKAFCAGANNAGVTLEKPTVELTHAVWDTVLAVRPCSCPRSRLAASGSPKRSELPRRRPDHQLVRRHPCA
jgi:enoyl-CoA hydratase/carnithine racemase